MIVLLEELTRIIAYGGFGWLLGYWTGVLVNDRHRLTTSILNEAERDMPTPTRRRLRSDLLQTMVVLAVMVAMLLTGIAWLQSARTDREQNRQDCEQVSHMADTLKARTNVYMEQVRSERRLWSDIRRLFEADDVPPGHPLMRSIDRYQDEQRQYLNHLRDNPVPTNLEGC